MIDDDGNEIITCYHCGRAVTWLNSVATCDEFGTLPMERGDDGLLDMNWDRYETNSHDNYGTYEFSCPDCGRQLTLQRIREHHDTARLMQLNNTLNRVE